MAMLLYIENTIYIYVFFIRANLIDLNYRCTVIYVCFEQLPSSCVITGRDESVNEEEKEEDEYLNLLYDPCLNCYFDPKTGKYYELAWLEAQENLD